MTSKSLKNARKIIMIAEDDESIIDAMKIMLEIHDYEVRTTVNGATIQDIAKEIPDLLLLDIWMAGMDGRVICKNMKNHARTKHIPVIMMSASHDLETSAKESGADDYLHKPFDMKELIGKIEKHVK